MQGIRTKYGSSMNQEKFLSILGWITMVTAMAMYISIGSNLAGDKGD